MSRLLRQVGEGHRVGSEDVAELARQTNLARLIALAGELRDAGHGHLVSYSKKVFLPLTHLCRDVCHYCVFAQPPKAGEAAFMSRAKLLEQAQTASAVGCKEALFTLGDKPELRYKAAREGLRELGHETTLSYLREAARLVFEESGLLPHLNPGLMTREDLLALRPVSASMGLMLESVSDRLMAKGEAHHGSPDKIPARRLETLRLAGEVAVPFTSGLLIGIGETRLERVESLLALRRLQEEQRPPPGSDHPELQGQARDPDGRGAGTGPRGPVVDNRRGEDSVRPRDEYPGASQSQPGRAHTDRGRRASTIGAACRRSPPISSTLKLRGRTSTI